MHLGKPVLLIQSVKVQNIVVIGMNIAGRVDRDRLQIGIQGVVGEKKGLNGIGICLVHFEVIVVVAGV